MTDYFSEKMFDLHWKLAELKGDKQIDYFSGEMWEFRGLWWRLLFWKKYNKDEAEPPEYRDEYNKKMELLLGFKFTTTKEEEYFWEKDFERIQFSLIF